MKDILNILRTFVLVIITIDLLVFIETGVFDFKGFVGAADFIFLFGLPGIVFFYFLSKNEFYKNNIELDKKKQKHLLKDSVERHSYKPIKKRK